MMTATAVTTTTDEQHSISYHVCSYTTYIVTVRLPKAHTHILAGMLLIPGRQQASTGRQTADERDTVV